MSKPGEFIEFKVETAENMSKDKIILLAHPMHEQMLAMLLYKIKHETDKNGENNA